MTPTNTTAKQIGHVEILKERTYKINPRRRDPFDEEAIVPAGTYPLYENEDGSRYWLMTGKRNDGGTQRIGKEGDGLFSIGPDKIGEETVEFPSMTFSSSQWLELLTDPVCDPSSDEHRLNITITS